MWPLCVLIFTCPRLFFFSCFSLVFISFPSSNFSPSPSYSSQLHPFAFFHILRSLSLPLLTLTVMSSCYFSHKLACHNLCHWVINVGLYSATMAPEKGQPKKKSPIPERWHHPLCQRKMMGRHTWNTNLSCIRRPKRRWCGRERLEIDFRQHPS